jgi:hypothetical protein
MSSSLVNVHFENLEGNQSVIYCAWKAVSELNKSVLGTRPVVGFTTVSYKEWATPRGESQNKKCIPVYLSIRSTRQKCWPETD